MVCVARPVMAQQRDSLYSLSTIDTLLQQSIGKADSITNVFQSKADSLNDIYQHHFLAIDAQKNFLQSRADSLRHLQLPTDGITKKLDSLNRVRGEMISSLTKKVDDLKAKATQGLEDLNLPPQLQEPLDKLHASIKDFSLPALDNSQLDFSKMDLDRISKMELPALGKQINLNTDISGITEKAGDISQLAGRAGEYSKDAQSLVKGNVDEVKNIDKTFEEKAMSMEGMDQLNDGKELIGQSGQLTDSAAMADMAKEQIMNAAQDHFAGKEEILQQAMDKMAKLKNRYTEVASMADLPKRLPNPLKGKPFIERIVLGITYQIQTSTYFLLDVNPMVMYLITPHLSAGGGWNERLAIDDWQYTSEERVYGPRVAVELKLPKGFNFRLLPEIMNTPLPPLMAQTKGVDSQYREWVPSVFFGMKKDFKVYKKIKGNTEILYNLYDPDGKSPYGDKLSVRFGFEFHLKKKDKASR